MIVQRSVAARDGFEAIIKVQDDLVERQFVSEHHAVGGDILKLFLDATLLFKQWQDAAEIFIRTENRRQDDRLFDPGDASGVWHLRGRINLNRFTDRKST